jgi:hypothetical protein
MGGKPNVYLHGEVSGRFLKKAPQKLFCPGASGVFTTARSGVKKFFGYFFSKK